MILGDRFHDDGVADIYLNPVQQNALAKFKEEFESERDIFESYDCDCGCKFDELQLIAEKDRYGLAVNTRICPKCGMMMTNPRMNQDVYNKFYDSLYRKIYVGRTKPGVEYYEIQRNRGEKITRYIMEHYDMNNVKSMLEIGCSAGGIVSVFKECGIPKCRGIDLGSEYIYYGISQGQDLENCNSAKLVKRGETYDLIVLHHVLEHFLDIEKELSVIRDLLSEDGILYIAVPGILNIHNGYQGDFLRFLQNAHIRHFSHHTLKQLLKWNGFDEVVGDEAAQGIYKKGIACREITNYYGEIIDYLKQLENKYLARTIDVSEVVSLSERRQGNVEILDQWLTFLRNGIEILDCLKRREIKKVAIYGWGYLGRQLYQQLERLHINVDYIVDQNRNLRVDFCHVYHPSDVLPETELLIIATSGDYYTIKKQIQGGAKNIWTIQDIFEMGVMEGKGEL